MKLTECQVHKMPLGVCPCELSMTDRAQAYTRAFPQWPASAPWIGQEQGREVLYAIWVIGNDYRNPTTFYGAYPRGYLDRVMSLFPDVLPGRLLHAYSGAIPQSDNYDRCDMKQDAEYKCNVNDLPSKVDKMYDLVLADPPYSAKDAEEYETPGVNRGIATRALAEIVEPGGFLAWLDTTWPMHTKTQWLTVGRIFIQRSTNHRVRLLSLFQRVSK